MVRIFSLFSNCNDVSWIYWPQIAHFNKNSCDIQFRVCRQNILYEWMSLQSQHSANALFVCCTANTIEDMTALNLLINSLIIAQWKFSEVLNSSNNESSFLPPTLPHPTSFVHLSLFCYLCFARNPSLSTCIHLNKFVIPRTIQVKHSCITCKAFRS